MKTFIPRFCQVLIGEEWVQFNPADVFWKEDNPCACGRPATEHVEVDGSMVWMCREHKERCKRGGPGYGTALAIRKEGYYDRD